jgi:hypothetical protein
MGYEGDMAKQNLRPISAPPAELRRVALHAVASGLTPLIPVPYLDDFAHRQVRERMVRDLLKDHLLPTPPRAVSILAGSHMSPNMRGRVVALVKSLALLPVRKVFRKAFVALWVKDCVDMASYALHHGYLLQHALVRADLDARALEAEAVSRVHDAILTTCKEVDTRPINQLLGRLFTSSRILVVAATRALKNPLHRGARATEQGEQAEVESLAEKLAAAMWEQRGYLTALEQRYEKHIGTTF